MASKQNLSTTHAQSNSNGGSAHPGTPIANEHYQFEWITSECEATGSLIDELRIVCDEYDAALSEPFIYDTHLQDHSSRKRRVVHPATRALREQATTASATASCESLPLQSTSSAKPEQYDFFQRYESTWDTRSITDCESVEATTLPELTRTDSGYESYVEKMETGTAISFPTRSGRLSEASTLAGFFSKSSNTINKTDGTNDQDALWYTHIPARDSMDLDRNGRRLCDGGRILASSSFVVLDERLPQDSWIPHRNSLDLDRNGHRLCTTRGSATACQPDRKAADSQLKRGWLKIKAKFCGRCEQERIEKRAMVNYL